MRAKNKNKRAKRSRHKTIKDIYIKKMKEKNK
jgi:hypothetical protein